MIERPILFSAPMVKAILLAQKTQTRRAVTGTPLTWLDQFLPEFVAAPENHLSPYGHAGDRLWVREAWLVDRYDGSTQYRASHPSPSGPKWKPSIHMPRERSRLNLHVNATRIERLQDITEADAIAEGVERNCDGLAAHPDCPPCKAAGKCQAEGEYIDYGDGDDGFPAQNARDSYRSLWDSLNAERGLGWDTNPWVWVVDFRVAT